VHAQYGCHSARPPAVRLLRPHIRPSDELWARASASGLAVRAWVQGRLNWRPLVLRSVRSLSREALLSRCALGQQGLRPWQQRGISANSTRQARARLNLCDHGPGCWKYRSTALCVWHGIGRVRTARQGAPVRAQHARVRACWARLGNAAVDAACLQPSLVLGPPLSSRHTGLGFDRVSALFLGAGDPLCACAGLHALCVSGWAARRGRIMLRSVYLWLP